MSRSRLRLKQYSLFLLLAGFVGLLGAAALVVLTDAGAGRATVGAPDVWHDDLDRTVDLTDKEAAQVLAAIRNALSRETGGAIDLGFLSPVPTAPHVVILSVSDGRSRARVGTGAGASFPIALTNAMNALRQLGITAQEAHWLRLDVVKGKDSHPRDLAGRRVPLPLPRDGVAFSRDTGLALLTPELAAHRALKEGGQLRVAWLPRLMQLRVANPWRVAMAELVERERAVLDQLTATTPFATDGFFSAGAETVRLSGTQRARNPRNPGRLMQAAREAGAYLQRMTLPDGRFVYSYLPGSDSAATEYNLLRHAGTAYAMLELYELAGDGALLADAQRAIDHLRGQVRDHPVTPGVALLVSEGAVKLGGVALAVVALAKHAEVTGDRRDLPRMQAMARYIQDSQEEDGSFVSQRFWPSLEVRTDFESQYYPGEAMLALLRLYALDRQDHWLDTVERAARYLINVRDAGVLEDRLVHDHWLLYALNELYRARQDPLYLHHALRIASAITASQNRNPYPPERLGIFAGRAESTPAATRTEGLIAAYALARDFGRKEDLAPLRNAIELGVGFQLQTQFLPERAMYLPNPQRALGGFHRSLTDYEIRIDYVQHNLSAILGLHRLLAADKAAR